jgi:hypothetical protein
LISMIMVRKVTSRSLSFFLEEGVRIDISE